MHHAFVCPEPPCAQVLKSGMHLHVRSAGLPPVLHRLKEFRTVNVRVGAVWPSNYCELVAALAWRVRSTQKHFKRVNMSGCLVGATR